MWTWHEGCGLVVGLGSSHWGLDCGVETEGPMGRAHGAPGAAFHLPSVKPKLQVVQTDWCRCPKQFGLVFHFSAYKKSWFGAIKLPS